MVIAIIISNDNSNDSNKVDLQTEKHHRKKKKEKKKQTNKLDLIKIFVRQTTKEIILLLMSQILNGNVKNC